MLKYNHPFGACQTFPCVGPTADTVFGQTNLTTNASRECLNTSGADAGSLCQPAAVAVDKDGNVFIADTGNNRVLEYDSGDATAHEVFGQTNVDATGCFSSPNPQDIGTVSADSLCVPSGVAVDAVGNLYVVDASDNRILRYNTPLNASSGEQGAGDT